MKKVVLYGNVRPIVGQSFKGVKVHTVPNQCFTLKEILHRFMKKEALPVEKEGIYVEGEGDLEKISKLDITEQMEYVESYKARVKGAREKIEEEAKPKSPPQPAPPVPQLGSDPLNPSGEPKPK